MTLPTTSGSLSAVQERVERGSADLREASYLGLWDACGDCFGGQITDSGRLCSRLCLRCRTPLPVGDECFTDLIHGSSVKHLTCEGKGRKVLYMETTQNLTIGTTVSYEDMANPPCQGIIADIETSRWGTQYVIAWNGYRAGEISTSDCRQHGWKVVA